MAQSTRACDALYGMHPSVSISAFEKQRMFQFRGQPSNRWIVSISRLLVSMLCSEANTSPWQVAA
jgi:hypothetical protein